MKKKIFCLNGHFRCTAVAKPVKDLSSISVLVRRGGSLRQIFQINWDVGAKVLKGFSGPVEFKICFESVC